MIYDRIVRYLASHALPGEESVYLRAVQAMTRITGSKSGAVRLMALIEYPGIVTRT